jgi:hypothetical protein
MSKKRKSAAELVSWSVWKIAGKPKLLGQVAATSEDEANEGLRGVDHPEEDRFPGCRPPGLVALSNSVDRTSFRVPGGNSRFQPN